MCSAGDVLVLAAAACLLCFPAPATARATTAGGLVTINVGK